LYFGPSHYFFPRQPILNMWSYCAPAASWTRCSSRRSTARSARAKIVQVADIPRTRSGKIVELAVRDVVHGRPIKTCEALANPEALELYKDRSELRV
jgi:hypothetical protein